MTNESIPISNMSNEVNDAAREIVLPLIVWSAFIGIAYGCPIGILFGSLFQNERDQAESLGQPGLRPAVNFRPYLPKLITVSMLLGALARFPTVTDRLSARRPG